MKRIIGAAILLAAPLAWLVATSAFLSNMAHVPFEWNLWWKRLDWWNANWWCDVLIIGSAVTPTIIVTLLLVAAALTLRSRRRRAQLVYGESGWANREQMDKGGISTSRKLP
jgi:hypothetical protein